MKGIDLFCASSASTAICVSNMDQRSMVRSGWRAIDRHNPLVRDGSRRRRRRSRSSALITSSTTTTTSNTNSSSQPIPSNKAKQHNFHHHHHHHHHQNKSTTSTSIRKKKTSTSSTNYKPTISSTSSTGQDVISPAGSSRYLLSNTPFFDVLSDQFDPETALVPLEPSSSSKSHASANSLEPSSSTSTGTALVPLEPSSSRPAHALAPRKPSSSRSRALVPLEPSSSRRSRSVDASPALLLPPSSSSSSSTRSPDQVVVLRVSLHCKGCEAKVRKHVSRMEGVTSFSIDFMAKKVTVIGDVTPLGVLASVSRVKNAQFWPSSSSTSAPPSTY